jgi:hypothetical protein
LGYQGGWTYCEEVKYCEGAIASWRGELSRCAQPTSIIEMEVDVSLVGGGSCSREVFKHCCIQGRMEEKVHITSVRPSKVMA